MTSHNNITHSYSINNAPLNELYEVQVIPTHNNVFQALIYDSFEFVKLVPQEDVILSKEHRQGENVFSMDVLRSRGGRTCSLKGIVVAP